MDVYQKLKAAVAAIRSDVGVVEKFLAVLAFLNAVAAIVQAQPPVFGAAADGDAPDVLTLDEAEQVADAGLAQGDGEGFAGVPVLLLLKIGVFLAKQIIKGL